jgi:hypothetical protein
VLAAAPVGPQAHQPVDGVAERAALDAALPGSWNRHLPGAARVPESERQGRQPQRWLEHPGRAVEEADRSQAGAQLG